MAPTSTIRNTKFTHILGQYGALGIASSVRVKELYTNFLDAMGLSETVRTLPCAGHPVSVSSPLSSFTCVTGHGDSRAAHAADVLRG